jgi:uncharacterized protein YhbP (UPF0306 family)
VNDWERLNTFLSKQKYMTISVILADGTPWATPVYIADWRGQSFEWDSDVSTEHSRAIAERPEVALTIFTPQAEGSEQFGFYAKASALLVGEPNSRGVGRYRANISRCWINDASYVKREVELA